MTEPIIINGFDAGIADSPHKGFGLMRQVDIESYPGAVKAGKDVSSIASTSFSQTFTADAGTDVCTISTGSVPNTTTAVYLTTTGTLPAGLSASTVYFIINVSTTTFKLATTVADAKAGTAVNITDAGTGTHTVQNVAVGTVNHFVRDPRTGEEFWLDSNGRVWYGTSILTLLHNSAIDTGSGSLTSANGKGMAISAFSSTTSTYLFVFRNAVIDVIDVFGVTNKESPSWTNAWQSMNSVTGSSNSHHAINAQDKIIYFCDDRFVGSIKENSGSTFDPATGGTYTYTNNALDLPPYEDANWLEELGIDLMIAGGSWNKVYPWDRSSSSFRVPLPVPENNVQRLKNIGGIVYILAGTWGTVYQTQGSYVNIAKRIPQQVKNNGDSILSNPVSWGGIDAVNGALLFGMSVQESGNSGAYLLYPDGTLVIDQVPSTGSANVTAFGVRDNLYSFGYNGGVDNHNDTDRYHSFEGIVQSEFYRVAVNSEKAAYHKLEALIAKPASTGGVRIGWRAGTSGSFTTLATFTCDGLTTLFEEDSIGLIDIENIQIQAELNDDVELVEIRLLP